MNDLTFYQAASERLKALRGEALYAHLHQAQLRAALALWLARTAIAIDHNVLQSAATKPLRRPEKHLPHG